MGVRLLERDQFLASLGTLLDEAAAGTGRCALVSGEAGIGKSSLIEQFAEQHGDAARICWGRCEALFTPRPLGPLHDIAQQLGGRILDMVSGEGNGNDNGEVSRVAIFSAFLHALSDGTRPTVAIFEDVHWADEATLDLLKFLGRRVQQASVLLIVTYRDDEIGPGHPLWFVLGDLPSRSTKRLHLTPLSREAVTTLAREAHHPEDNLYAITAGNPFFVTEVLAGEGAGVPETVRAAVLARVARLSPQGYAVLEYASVVPARIELSLLDALVSQPTSAIEECIVAGVLRQEGDTVAFRHELARQAVESTILPTCQRDLHIEVLRALQEQAQKGQSVAIARLVHHAAHAGDGEAVLRYAPDAARQAAQQGAHREAATQFETALRYGSTLPPGQRAELLEGRAYECYITSQLEEAAQARADALALWSDLGEHENVGRSQRWLSRLNWYLGENAAAERYGADAVATLEALPLGKELAMAYSNLAQLRMLEDDLAGTLHWGTRALELAETLGDVEIKVHALNNIGTIEVHFQDDDGWAKLEESLRLALEHGFEEHAARAYTNLASVAVARRDYARAQRYHSEGIAYCTEHDLDAWRLYMTSWRARASFETGHWVDASDDAEDILASYRATPIVRISALVVLATMRLRRGDPGSQPLLEEAWQMALKMDEAQRLIPVAVALAEAAWLRGDLAAAQSVAREAYERTLVHADPWSQAQLAYWRWKTGATFAPPPNLPEPYALQIAGDWRAAAAAWERIGCPYEQALALSEGDAKAQRAALAIHDHLGAHATANSLRALRTQMGDQQSRGTARGPRPSTRGNPAGLTNQQMEVLALLASGLHNAEIAETLHVSPKTVEHHVSAVLAKLNARSRAQAVAQAHNLGVVPK